MCEQSEAVSYPSTWFPLWHIKQVPFFLIQNKESTLRSQYPTCLWQMSTSFSHSHCVEQIVKSVQVQDPGYFLLSSQLLTFWQNLSLCARMIPAITIFTSTRVFEEEMPLFPHPHPVSGLFLTLSVNEAVRKLKYRDFS